MRPGPYDYPNKPENNNFSGYHSQNYPPKPNYTNPGQPSAPTNYPQQPYYPPAPNYDCPPQNVYPSIPSENRPTYEYNYNSQPAPAHYNYTDYNRPGLPPISNINYGYPNNYTNSNQRMPVPNYPAPSQDVYGQRCPPPYPPQRITPKYIDRGMAIPSLRPILEVSPLSDASTLHKAYKGIGCDKRAVLNIVTRRTCSHREQIKKEYLRLYGKSLIQRTESELRDPLERVVVSLLYSGADLDAYTLRKATKGLGTDEPALMHILCTRSSFQISKIKESYIKLFGRSLQDHITSDTSGSFKKILLCLLNEPRDQSNIADPTIAAQQVSEIYSRCSMRMKAPESLIPIFCRTNYCQLRLTFEKFQLIHGKTIYRYVKEFFEGDYERTLMTICNYVINPFHYFSKHLKLGIINGDINQVIRVVCTRCEIDLTNIINDYKIIFGTNAAVDIRKAFELQHRETVDALLMLMGQQ